MTTTLVPTTPSPRMLVRKTVGPPWPDFHPDAEAAVVYAALDQLPVICRWEQLEPLWDYYAVDLAQQARQQAIVRRGARVRLTGSTDDVRRLVTQPCVTIDRWFNTPSALGIERFYSDVTFFRAAA